MVRFVRFFAAVVIIAVSACDSPSPRLMRGERHTLEVDGSTFTVWRRGEEVEVYRTSVEFMPRMSEVFAKAETAIRQATGCAVVPGSLAGDAALMVAELDCDGA